MNGEIIILGVNKRYYPAQRGCKGLDQNVEFAMDSSFDPPPTVCVLVAGEIGDYAAYVGHGDPLWVARFGDKIRFEEACCHFPGGQLKRELYRD